MIEFGYSSSSNFELALQEAQKFANFQQANEGKKARYRVCFDPKSIDMSLELVKYIKGWKSSKIFVDGERNSWENVYSFLWCYENKCSSYKPDIYCFGYENDYDINIWGCTQARLPFRDHAPWVEWGAWQNKKCDWRFDKDRIRHELQKELYKYRFCPAINFDFIDDALEAFPEIVNPRKDKNWKFVESWGDDDISSKLVITTRKYGYEEKVVMKGVAPKGLGAMKQIMKKMKHKLPNEIFS